MSASPHPKRRQRTDDTQQARQLAASRFIKGDRVRHCVTGKFGSFVEINSGFALLEVWVHFDSETDTHVPTSCNSLDLELVAKDYNQTSSAIAPEIVEELTEQEERDRHRLELRVERAFYEAGAALRELSAAVVDNLFTNGEQILPTNERQVRDMIRHSPELQCSI